MKGSVVSNRTISIDDTKVLDGATLANLIFIHALRGVGFPPNPSVAELASSNQAGGVDEQTGGNGGDILIAGLVRQANDQPVDFLRIRAEWTSGNPIA